MLYAFCMLHAACCPVSIVKLRETNHSQESGVSKQQVWISEACVQARDADMTTWSVLVN